MKNGLHVWRSQTPQTRVTVKSENIKLCFESAVSGGTSRAPALARLLFPSTISTFSSESFEHAGTPLARVSSSSAPGHLPPKRRLQLSSK